MNWKVLLGGTAVIVPLIAVLFNGFKHDPHEFTSPLIDKPAPDFTLTSLEGAKVHLADLKGKPVVINFWATWCVPCRDEGADLQAAATQQQGRVAFYGVVYQDEPESIRSWLKQYGGGTYPQLVDEGSRAALAFGVYGVPETYVIDAAGVIRHKFVGPVTLGEIRAELGAL